MLAHVFENFRNVWLGIYELDPAKFLSVLAVAWQVALKVTEVKLELITGIEIY